MFPSYYGIVELILTDYCPFHCKYCFVKDKNECSTMSMDVVDKTFSLFNFLPRAIFMGGEPLVEVDLINKIITKYPNVNYQVVTSGLINLSYFAENIRPKVNKFDLQVSWDGFITSRENPEKVWDEIENVLKMGQGVQARCVISDVNALQFYNVFNLFAERHRKYPKFYADFTFAYVGDMEEFTPKIIECQLLQILYAAKEDNYSFFPQTISRYVHKYLTKDNCTGFCGIGNYAAIRPNGDVYPCTSVAHLGRYCVGNVLGGRLDFDSVPYLRHNTAPQCVDCPVLYMCGGGCKYERMLCNGNEWSHKVVEHRCAIMKAIYNAIDTFYSTLSIEEQYSLVDIVTKFHMWETSYLVQDKQSEIIKEQILRR